MVSSPTTIPYVPIRDFIDKWGWSESFVKQLIVSETIKPSFSLGDRATDYVYFETVEKFFGPPDERPVTLNSFAASVPDGAGLVSHRQKLFLQRPTLTGHNDCEFTLATFKPNPPLARLREHWEYELTWVMTDKAITLNEVIKNGFFSDLEIQRLGGLDKLLNLVPKATVIQNVDSAATATLQGLVELLRKQQEASPPPQHRVDDDTLTVQHLRKPLGIKQLQDALARNLLTSQQVSTVARNLNEIHGNMAEVGRILHISGTAVANRLKKVAAKDVMSSPAGQANTKRPKRPQR